MGIRTQGAVSARLIDRVLIFIHKTFPERQLIYRSQGRTRYLLFSRSAQITLCSIAFVALSWIVYASSHVYFSGRLIDAKDQKIVAMEMAYDSLTGEWADAQQRFLSVTDALEAKHLQLIELFQRRTSLERKLGLLSPELDLVTEQRDEAHHLSGNPTKRVGLLRMPLQDTTSDRYLAQGFLSTTETPHNSLSEKQRKAFSAPNSAKIELNPLAVKHLQALRKEAELRRKVGELEMRLTVIKSSQRQLVERVKDRTQTKIRELESLVAATGLPPNLLLARSLGSAPDSLGGPLVHIPETASGEEGKYPAMEDPFGQSIGELEDLWHTWASLQLVLDTIPLTAPIRDYRVVSGWGKRRDPFTKR